MIVALSHPLAGADLPATWTKAACAERLSLLRDGAEALYPAREFRLPARGEARLQRIGGDDRVRCVGAPFGPAAFNAELYLAPADMLWVVGPVCDEVRDDKRIAEELGVAVVDLGELEQGELLAAGRSARRRREEAALEAAVEAALDENRVRPDFRGAGAVARARFEGAGSLLGVEGVDYERKMSSGGSRATRRDRGDLVGLRLARSARLMKEAGLSKEELLAVRLRNASGATWAMVAKELGWEDDGASRKRAERLVGRAMGKLTQALRRMEAGDDGRA